MSIKNIIKTILPKQVIHHIKNLKKYFELLNAYFYDFKRFWKYSLTQKTNDKYKLEAIIIKHYHIIEKGLTMPTPRLGFGEEMIIRLSDDCLLFLSKYKDLSMQVEHAISVIKEYKNFHYEHNFNLSDKVNVKINTLLQQVEHLSIVESSQTKYTKESYFQYRQSSFDLFSSSRKSVRNYIEADISKEKIESALKLAMNTPSACNRQSTRIHIFNNKERIKQIFTLQNGNRGFGHLASTLIIVSADLSSFGDAMERNQAFIDGGMFAMNLLYCLHYENIACCILNCSNTPKQDIQIQNICNIPKSNVFIAMIACGLPPDDFMVANSLRYNFNDVCKID